MHSIFGYDCVISRKNNETKQKQKKTKNIIAYKIGISFEVPVLEFLLSFNLCSFVFKLFPMIYVFAYVFFFFVQCYCYSRIPSLLCLYFSMSFFSLSRKKNKSKTTNSDHLQNRKSSSRHLRTCFIWIIFLWLCERDSMRRAILNVQMKEKRRKRKAKEKKW